MNENQNNSNKSSKTDEIRPEHLWDRHRRLFLSDFSPYHFEDEMVAYFGFEPYENNLIGRNRWWTYNPNRVTRDASSFTGSHVLRLEGSTNYLEGLIVPKFQSMNFIASCWLRSSTHISKDSIVKNLRAIVSTQDEPRLVTLLAQSKKQIGDWTYLELPVDFTIINQIHHQYLTYVNKTNVTSESNHFKITLRVEAEPSQKIDLDHIRFSPFKHDFEVNFYDWSSLKKKGTVQKNGQITRIIHDRVGKEIASLDIDDTLESFSSSTQSGRLFPKPNGFELIEKPCKIQFTPESGSYERFDLSSQENRWYFENSSAWRIASGQVHHRSSTNQTDTIKLRKNIFDDSYAAIRLNFALNSPVLASLTLKWDTLGSLTLIQQSNDLARLALPDGKIFSNLPTNGELIVMVEQNYIYIWIDGVLLVDTFLRYYI